MIAIASGWLSRRPRSRRPLGDVRRDVDQQTFLLVLAEEHKDLPLIAKRCSQHDVSAVLPGVRS